jgi:tetratricopeptide (TPR) repeat protein
MQSNDLMAQEVKNESLRKSALTQMNAGRFGEAIDLLNKFISANPQYAEGYNLRGICHRARNQFQNAVLDFRRAVKLKPDYRDAARNLAEAQAIWYAELEKKILGHKREIAINPDTPYNYLEIGKSYRWMEEWALAEEWYDQYLARDDDASPDEIIRYSEILAKTKHIRKGEKILKIYVERYPDDWRLWSKYGYFTMWMGRYKNAAKAFRTALQFKPYFKEAQDGLDMATKQAYVTQQDPRAFEKAD